MSLGPAPAGRSKRNTWEPRWFLRSACVIRREWAKKNVSSICLPSKLTSTFPGRMVPPSMLFSMAVADDRCQRWLLPWDQGFKCSGRYPGSVGTIGGVSLRVQKTLIEKGNNMLTTAVTPRDQGLVCLPERLPPVLPSRVWAHSSWSISPNVCNNQSTSCWCTLC